MANEEHEQAERNLAYFVGVPMKTSIRSSDSECVAKVRRYLHLMACISNGGHLRGECFETVP